MEAILLYFGKVIVCSGVMFLYYQLSLKDKTFHHYNRFYLLSAMLISLLLPLIKVEDFTIAVSSEMYLLIDKIQNFNTTKTIHNDHIYFRIIFSALGLVSFYFLARLLYGIFKIQKFKNQFQKESFDGINFYHTNLTEAPFSYFKNLFWKNTIMLNSDIGKQILKHEMVHIEQKHSFDKIFIEVITAIFWFNPFFHIIKKEISLIHEYLADKKAVKKSDTKAFAQMLLASHFSGTRLPATSPFLSSNLKKRLKMLQKPQTKFGYARRIFALPVLFTVAFAYMVNAKNKEIAETNIEIEKAVSEIKKDTISPKNNIDQIVERQEAKISKANKELKIQSEKLKTLSEKSKEKAAELKKIAKEKGEESYEFELKAKELKQLSGEMDRIADRVIVEKDDKVIFNDLEFRTASPDGKNYTFRLNENRGNTIDMSNHEGEGYKKLKKVLDNRVAKIFEGKNDYADSSFRTPPTPITPPIVRGYTGVAKYTEVKPYVLSKKDQRKLEKLAKEKAELTRKQAEISKKQAEIVKDQIPVGNPWIIGIGAHAKPDVKYIVKSNYVDGDKRNDKDYKTNLGINKIYVNGKDTSESNIKIIIDGKEATQKEMNALDSEKIRDIHVKKNNVDGKMEGEISINTKK